MSCMVKIEKQSELVKGWRLKFKFFYRKASMRRSKNKIRGLFDTNCCWQEDLRAAEGVIGRYFVKTFTFTRPSDDHIERVVSSIRRRVTREMNDKLMATFTIEKLRATLLV